MKINSSIFLIRFALISSSIGLKSCVSECCFNSSFAYYNNQGVSLSYFDQFSQLKFECDSPIKMTIWEIYPYPLPLILDNSLNLSKTRIRLEKNYFQIGFSNLKGFDLNSNPFENLKLITNQGMKIDYVQWQFKRTVFDFYLQNNLINSSVCNSNIQNWKMLSTIRYLELIQIVFSSEICPFVFKNASLKLLSIWISSSFISERTLKFQNVSASNLNSTVFHVDLFIYHVNLNEIILNKNVFEKMIILDLTGPIKSIQDDLFKSFNKLRVLRLRTQNVRKHFANNNKWLNSLNLYVNDWSEMNGINSLILVVYQAYPNVTFYQYPDEDFCNFKSFPHKKNVLPLMKPIFNSKCTCLELFLIQYSARYSDSILEAVFNLFAVYENDLIYSDTHYEKKFSNCFNSSFDEYLQSCNFSERLNKCQIQQILNNNNDNNNDFVVYFHDWFYISNIFQTILPKYLYLIFSILGLVANLLLILCLSNKKIISDKMYTYLLINAYFNIFYCLTITFKSAVSYFENRFSSSIFVSKNSITFELLNLYLIKFGTNIFKTGSNISYFMFVLSRYFMVTGKKGLFVEKFQKFNRGLFIFLTVSISVLFNIQIIFKFTNKYSELDYFPNHFFISKTFSENYNKETIDDYKEIFSSKSEYLILNIADYIRLIFSDLAHIIANTVIDLCLFNFVRKKIKSKTDMLEVNLEKTNRILKAKIKKRVNHPNNRISLMILLNGINFLVLRLPLSLLSFYGFFFRYDRETKSHMPNVISYLICKELLLCNSLQGLFVCNYMMSFIFQFFILYKLDHNLKLSFLGIMNAFRIKIESFQNKYCTKRIETRL